MINGVGVSERDGKEVKTGKSKKKRGE